MRACSGLSADEFRAQLISSSTPRIIASGQTRAATGRPPETSWPATAPAGFVPSGVLGVISARGWRKSRPDRTRLGSRLALGWVRPRGWSPSRARWTWARRRGVGEDGVELGAGAGEDLRRLLLLRRRAE